MYVRNIIILLSETELLGGICFSDDVEIITVLYNSNIGVYEMLVTHPNLPEVQDFENCLFQDSKSKYRFLFMKE